MNRPGCGPAPSICLGGPIDRPGPGSKHLRTGAWYVGLCRSSSCQTFPIPIPHPRGPRMPDRDGGGFFPRWTLKREGVIAPDERLPWGQTFALGIQHVFAMFGATVLVPILMGFDPNTAIFFSGIGTLLFFLVVGGRVPSYLGSSFAFVAVVLTATGYQGPGPNANIGL